MFDRSAKGIFRASAIGFTYLIRYLANADRIWTDAFFDTLGAGYSVQVSADTATTMVSDLVGG